MGSKGTWLKFFVWTIGILVVLELGLRLFGYGRYTVFVPDERTIWVPAPGHNKLTVVNHMPENVNAQGFRSRDDLAPKKSGQVSIFTFGDSVTNGWGVADDQTYSAVLESLLNSTACPRQNFQVVNAGVNAYSNSLAADRLKAVIDDNYQPDIVVLAYAFNTGFERLAFLEGAERQNMLRRVELKSYARRSALYNFLIEDVLRSLVYYRFREMLIQGTWNTQKSVPDMDPAPYKVKLTNVWQLCKDRKVQMVMLMLGSQDQRTELDQYQTTMLDFARDHKVPLVNMIDVLRSKDHSQLYMDHVHPTAPAHRMIAEELYKVIRPLDSNCSR
jgi:lysophospholipase L1-like esterase